MKAPVKELERRPLTRAHAWPLTPAGWGWRLKRSFAEPKGLQPAKPTSAGGRRDQRCMRQLNFVQEAREVGGGVVHRRGVSILPPATRVSRLQHALVPRHRCRTYFRGNIPASVRKHVLQ